MSGFGAVCRLRYTKIKAPAFYGIVNIQGRALLLTRQSEDALPNYTTPIRGQ